MQPHMLLTNGLLSPREKKPGNGFSDIRPLTASYLFGVLTTRHPNPKP